MKKTNKKGFTIVELVIVIAVIAILAAVLIPTFSGVVTKANESKALQAARNCYTELMADTNATVANFESATNKATILTETGVTSVAYTAGQANTKDETVAFVVGEYTVTYVVTANETDSKIGWTVKKTTTPTP